MIRLKLVPEDTSIDFIRMRFIALAFSAVALVGSVVAFFTMGLNFGIDFRGGTTFEISVPAPAALDEIRELVGGLDLGDVKVQQVQELTAANDGRDIVAIFVEQQDVSSLDEGADDQAQQVAASRVQDALTEGLGLQRTDFRSIEIVGPTVSAELVRGGVMAVGVAVVLMLIYIWFRFEWQFSLGAIAALVHDVLLTIGMFSVTQLVFNLPIIAAILTIIGYSMNDTVVVYDRVRENLRKFKKMPLADVLNLSINNTLSRTVMTSVTTLLALVSLYVLGGEVLRGFTFAMIWGILVGTYSSVFIASPALLTTGVKRDWSNAGE